MPSHKVLWSLPQPTLGHNIWERGRWRKSQMGANMILHQNIESVSNFWLQFLSLTFFLLPWWQGEGRRRPPWCLAVDDYLDRASLTSTLFSAIAQIQNTKYSATQCLETVMVFPAGVIYLLMSLRPTYFVHYTIVPCI